MPQALMHHEVDPKESLLARFEKYGEFKLFHNQILCAVYKRPEKTKSGIHLPDQYLREDETQGKVGLVVQIGPDAFRSTDAWPFTGVDAQLHDWVVFRASDGWPINVNGVLCRILNDTSIRAKVSHPDTVW